MTLSEWMRTQGLTDEMLARRLRRHRTTVSKLRRRGVLGGGLIRQIVQESNGAVSANELLGLTLRSELVPSAAQPAEKRTP